MFVKQSSISCMQFGINSSKSGDLSNKNRLAFEVV
jgi:hypothetical protein